MDFRVMQKDFSASADDHGGILTAIVCAFQKGSADADMTFRGGISYGADIAAFYGDGAFQPLSALDLKGGVGGRVESAGKRRRVAV